MRRSLTDVLQTYNVPAIKFVIYEPDILPLFAPAIGGIHIYFYFPPKEQDWDFFGLFYRAACKEFTISLTLCIRGALLSGGRLTVAE